MKGTTATRFFAKKVLLISMLGSILSFIGGGFIVPPFKSFAWVTSSQALYGIYGGCLSPPSPYDTFLSIDPNWNEHQKKFCYNVLRAIQNGWSWELPQDIPSINPKLAFAICLSVLLGAFFAIGGFMAPSRKSGVSSGTYALMAFILSTTGFAISVYSFSTLIKEIELKGNNATFDIGFFLQVASCGGYLIATVMLYSLRPKQRKLNSTAVRSSIETVQA